MTEVTNAIGEEHMNQRNLFLGAQILSAITMCLLVGCQPPLQKQVVGTWYCHEFNVNTTFQLGDDGKATVFMDCGPGGIATHQGTWQLDGNVLTPDTTSVEALGKLAVVSVEGDTMTCTRPGKSRQYEFRRVDPPK